MGELGPRSPIFTVVHFICICLGAAGASTTEPEPDRYGDTKIRADSEYSVDSPKTEISRAKTSPEEGGASQLRSGAGQPDYSWPESRGRTARRSDQHSSKTLSNAKSRRTPRRN